MCVVGEEGWLAGVWGFGELDSDTWKVRACVLCVLCVFRYVVCVCTLFARENITKTRTSAIGGNVELMGGGHRGGFKACVSRCRTSSLFMLRSRTLGLADARIARCLASRAKASRFFVTSTMDAMTCLRECLCVCVCVNATMMICVACCEA